MGRYRRVRVVGNGNFGCCWLVEAGGEQFILKAIDISKMPAKQRDEAANEVKVLAKLRHPYIINFRESYVEDGLLCIITDYAEAGDLYKLIHLQRSICLFEESLVLRWFTQVCLALKHMHDRHVLHRDLKTQNIFVSGPRPGTMKLGDFGIARVLQHTQDCAKTAIGTPYYLSPEICQEKPYNYKSDIWSLGCVLFELASLQHAFDADSMRGLVIKILKGMPPPLPSSFSADLCALVPSMLTKDPQLRPAINQVLRRPIVRAQIKLLLHDHSHEARSSDVAQAKAHGATPSVANVSKPAPEPQRQSATDVVQTPVSHHRRLERASASHVADGNQWKWPREAKPPSMGEFSHPSSCPKQQQQQPPHHHIERHVRRSQTPARSSQVQQHSVQEFHHPVVSATRRIDERRNCAQARERSAADGRLKRDGPAREERARSVVGSGSRDRDVPCAEPAAADEGHFLLKTLEALDEDDHEPRRFRGPDGQLLDLPSAGNSISYRIEALKVYLETELGLKDFLFLYRYLSETYVDRCESLESKVSTKAISFLPLIHQLLVCEDEYFEQRV